MTYCVAIKLNAGLVFLSDSRTNAGLDQISSFRKMMVYEKAGERFMVLLSAGNLSISQSVREILQTTQIKDEADGEPITIWNARSMFDAARVLGAAVRHVHERDGASLKRSGVDFNVSLVLGGQIQGEGMRLFQVYSAGNFIEATSETPYFQVGESKYGKPVLDRVLTPETPLDEAAKCALVSMDSTLKSNLSVGLPLDLVLYAPTRSSASPRTTLISACCTTAGAKSCARCSTASKAPTGAARRPRCRSWCPLRAASRSKKSPRRATSSSERGPSVHKA